MKKATASLAITFECVDLPGADDPRYTELRLGIQEGVNVVQDVACNQPIVRFACMIQVDRGQPELDFRGTFVQGPRSGRFIYLCWGERRDGVWIGSRRAKIPLSSIPPSLVETAIQTETPIQATIGMKDNKGEPVAATLKPDRITWSIAAKVR
jgi:hypothetical protein